MKKHFVTVGVLLFTALIGMVLTSVGTRALPLAGARLLGQGRSMLQGFHQVAGIAQVALPRVAVYLSDAFLVLLGALALLFIHLLVMVPVQLHRLQRRMKDLQEQVNLLRREMFTELSAQIPGVGQESPARRVLDESGIVSRSPRAAG